MHVRKFILLLSLILLCLFSWGDTCRAEDNGNLEARVKSAFIYNFIQFTQWPANTFPNENDPLIVGVLDPDPLAGILDETLKGKFLDKHELVVRHITSVDHVSECHVIFVGDNQRDQVDAVIKAIGAKSILSVGDSENFTDLGGIIRFYLENGKIRFEINLTAAERAHLQLSSKLLKLARIVRK